MLWKYVIMEYNPKNTREHFVTKNIEENKYSKSIWIMQS